AMTGRMVVGGEALQWGQIQELTERGWDMEIINEYGPTEATVGCCVYRLRTIGNENGRGAGVPIGRPMGNVRIYIVDKTGGLSPVGVAGELWIGGQQLARGYWNRSELTAEKFIRDPFSQDPEARVYRTGDKGRWLRDGNIEYLGRMDEQVKIRGYRVEPGEIEGMLEQSGLVRQTAVVAREDGAGGKRLVGYVVGKEGYHREALIGWLRDRLPEYMIPVQWMELEAMPLTVNGKIDRRALPETEAVEVMASYVAPRTACEQTLVEIWKETLELEELGITENFFTAGGDSIKAIVAVSRIRSALSTELQLADLFEHTTVLKLAAFLDKNHVDREYAQLSRKISEQVEVLRQKTMQRLAHNQQIEEVYPMSDIQKGMLFFSSLNPGLPVYHDQFAHEIVLMDFEPELFARAFQLLVDKHSILRTIFDFEEALQLVLKKIPLEIGYIDLRSKEPDEQRRVIHDHMVKERSKAFNYWASPLWRASLFRTHQDAVVFLFQFHHAILDGWSRASFETELHNLYISLKRGVDHKPGALRSTNKDAVIGELIEKCNEENLRFWENEMADHRRVDIFSSVPTAQNFNKRYDADLAKRIKAVAKENDMPVKNFLFAAVWYTIKLLTYSEDVTVGLVTHNRPAVEDGEKILGCFLNTVPVRISLNGERGLSWRAYFQKVKQKLEEIKKRERTTLLDISNRLGEKPKNGNPFFDIIFNYTDFYIYKELYDESSGSDRRREPGNFFSFELTNTYLDIGANLTDNGLFVHYILTRELKSGISLEQFHGYFERVLDRALYFSEELIMHDRLLSVAATQNLFRLSHGGHIFYPPEETMVSLFEEQVRRTPGALSVVFKEQALTYRELDEWSNRVGHALYRKGAGPEVLVPICVERSLEMVVGMLAILKTGGAYVPIDPAYPVERIGYMLADTGAKLVVSSRACRGLLGEGVEVVLLDGEDHLSELSCAIGGVARSEQLAYVIYTSGSTGRPKG
ncbi:MAG TPA: AMP-binding protein, partial [Puia sp.]|nr:AMP-binding protein [Puia sp.]